MNDALVRKALETLWESGHAWQPIDTPEFHSGSDSEACREHAAQQQMARSAAVRRAMAVIKRHASNIDEPARQD